MDSATKMPAGPAKDSALARLRQPVRDGKVQYAQRLYIGRDRAKASVLQLSDTLGRPRIRIKVDSTGAPSLEFLDEQARVISRLPEARR
jgi:hypothetical protein